ncbi:hypothetical protein FRC03_000264 [Tulasnella sp. 419]|nr:hypothetical protein FRC03_000264 [Tulasnella sp. 419]
MSTQQADQSPLSLLSLAASQAKPQPFSIPRSAATTSVSHPSPFSSQSMTAVHPDFNMSLISGLGSARSPSSANGSVSVVSRGNAQGSNIKHRRLSSTGQSRRRLSDATAATFQAAATSTFVRSTSVSSNTSTGAVPMTSAVSSTAAIKGAISKSVPKDDASTEDGQVNGAAKKKGTIYRCESCSKVYRHPNCLLKHRWEHSPHWREASKFLLSKHQQVQLLEAAAILSHLTPKESGGQGGTSLPEDRSLWPSYLSGGLLPAPSTSTPSSAKPSNIGLTKGRPPAAASTNYKKDDSSEEETFSSSGSRDSGYGSAPGMGPSSSSLPAQAGLAFGAKSPVISNIAGGAYGALQAEKNPGSQPMVSGSVPGAGFYFGSMGAMPLNSVNGWGQQQHSLPNSPVVGSTSAFGSGPGWGAMSAGSNRRLSRPPGSYRHTRTSSSLSSSYTRSSLRGGVDDDDEEDEEDEFGEVETGYMVSAKPPYQLANMSLNGGTAPMRRGFSDPQQHLHSKNRGMDEEMEMALDEEDEENGDDTADEESEDAGGHNGAGMELDMDL